jgi:hypothetical protein
MTAADRPAFAELLALLGETFHEPISEGRVAGYWIALSDMPLPALQAAVCEALRTCRFFPRPAELRECAGYVPVSPAWVNQQLSKGRRSVGPFVWLFVERLGGWRSVEDRRPLARLPLVERLYPRMLAEARARSIEVPMEAQESGPLALPALTDRALFESRTVLSRAGQDLVGDESPQWTGHRPAQPRSRRVRDDR